MDNAPYRLVAGLAGSNPVLLSSPVAQISTATPVVMVASDRLWGNLRAGASVFARVKGSAINYFARKIARPWKAY